MNVQDSVVAKALGNSLSIPRDLVCALTIRDPWEKLLPSRSVREFVRTEHLRDEFASSYADEVMRHSALETAAQHAAPQVLARIQEEWRRGVPGASAAWKQAAATLERVPETCGTMDCRAFAADNALDQAIEATSLAAQYARSTDALAPSAAMRLTNLARSSALSQDSVTRSLSALDAAHALRSTASEHADMIQRGLNQIMNFAASQPGFGAMSDLSRTTINHLRDARDQLGVDRLLTEDAAVPKSATDDEAKENKTAVAPSTEAEESAQPSADETTVEVTCELWRTSELILKVARRVTLQAHRKKLAEAIVALHSRAGNYLAPHELERLVGASHQFCEHFALVLASPGPTRAGDSESPSVEWAELVIANCRELQHLVLTLARSEWPCDDW